MRNQHAGPLDRELRQGAQLWVRGEGPRATEQGQALGEHGQGAAGSGPTAPAEGGGL